MATAEQIKALIRSHFSDDSERFLTLALQVAAHEARQGHGPLAHEIRDLVDRARSDRKRRTLQEIPTELDALVQADLPGVPLSALVLSDDLMGRISRVIHEYRQREKLRLHALSHRRKLLLTGPPGTGKTLTARVLAHELRLPLFTVQADRLMTKFMGETGARLRQMFELIREREGVYLFDEFDALGGGRTRENDVGEMRRVLTALLQFIEAESSDSIIVASTNSPELLDRALFRRFDDILTYSLPGEGERKRLMANTLGTYLSSRFGWKTALAESAGLSSAEVVEACRDALKAAVLKDLTKISAVDLRLPLAERRHGHGGQSPSCTQKNP
ncbi:MAG: ATP-binding protein [Fimbriimonadaceae bacterium]|nr:ATP-binding protein [Fimbriimonadaceae bacterium]